MLGQHVVVATPHTYLYLKNFANFLKFQLSIEKPQIIKRFALLQIATQELIQKSQMIFPFTNVTVTLIEWPLWRETLGSVDKNFYFFKIWSEITELQIASKWLWFDLTNYANDPTFGI